MPRTRQERRLFPGRRPACAASQHRFVRFAVDGYVVGLLPGQTFGSVSVRALDADAVPQAVEEARRVLAADGQEPGCLVRRRKGLAGRPCRTSGERGMDPVRGPAARTTLRSDVLVESPEGEAGWSRRGRRGRSKSSRRALASATTCSASPIGPQGVRGPAAAAVGAPGSRGLPAGRSSALVDDEVVRWCSGDPGCKRRVTSPVATPLRHAWPRRLPGARARPLGRGRRGRHPGVDGLRRQDSRPMTRASRLPDGGAGSNACSTTSADRRLRSACTCPKIDQTEQQGWADAVFLGQGAEQHQSEAPRVRGRRSTKARFKECSKRSSRTMGAAST